MWWWIACAPQLPDLDRSDRLPPGATATIDAPFEPLPRRMDLDRDRVALGERLFADPALSGDGTVSCANCHDLRHGGIAPREARSNHPTNETGPYNVPTVFNVAFLFRYNWNGSFDTLEDHLGGPMMSAVVMNAGSWEAVADRVGPAYREDFRAAGYPQLDEAALREVIAEYQRSLVTPDAPFDLHLRGERPLTGRERAGFELFLELGCSTCHQGIAVGGNLFQRFGVLEDPFDRPLRVVRPRAPDRHR